MEKRNVHKKIGNLKIDDMKIVSFLILMMLSCGGNSICAQEVSWEASVSTDSLLMGNRVKVSFTLKEAKGHTFSAPNFEGFAVLSGPNQSTQMSVMNGEMSQSQSFSFYLEAQDLGTYLILPASIKVDGEYLETAPIEIVVFPNPDGIKQPIQSEQRNEWNPFNFEQMMPQRNDPNKDQLKKKAGKKKRKIYKI